MFYCLAFFRAKKRRTPNIFLHSVLDVEGWTLDVFQRFAGGVAERLIAPVLKTGGPKGLVSSNLTPSAIPFSSSDYR